MSNPAEQKFQGSKTSSQSRHMYYTREKIYKKFIFGGGGGSWGALKSNPAERKYEGSKTSSQSRHMYYTREKNNHQFFIYGPQCKKNTHFWLFGGPGWPINNQTGPILLPSYPLTYINLHIKY